MNYLFCSARITFAVLVIGAVVCLFIPKFKERQQNQETLTKLHADIKADEARLSDVKQKQRMFQTDPRFVERVAHDHGMVRQGEKLYKFESSEYE